MTQVEQSEAADENPYRVPKGRAKFAGSLMGVGAGVEIYATAAMLTEQLPGHTGVIVGAGAAALVGSIGVLMPTAENHTASDESGD